MWFSRNKLRPLCRTTLRVRLIYGIASLFCVGMTTPALAQRTLKVRSESRIDLRLRSEGATVWAEGILQDDLGAPLGNERLALTARHTHVASSTRRLLWSDASGAFHAKIEGLRPGTIVTVSFEGTPLIASSRARRKVDPARDHVRLDLRVRSAHSLDLAGAPFAVTVQADSPAGGSQLNVTLTNELGTVLARGITNQAGVVTFQIGGPQLGPPGAGFLRVRSQRDDAREEALTEVPVLRRLQTQLTLDWDAASEGSPQPIAAGTLVTALGPLANQPVGLFEGNRHIESRRTGTDGKFSFAVSRKLAGPLHVEFVSNTLGYQSSRSGMIRFPNATSRGRLWLWALLSCSLAALAFGWSRRRRRASTPATSTLPVPPVVAAGATLASRQHRRAVDTAVSGILFDSVTKQPVAGAVELQSRVGAASSRLTTGSDGKFEFRGVSTGHHTMVVQVSGYEPLTFDVRSPHRGEFCGLAVSVISYRTLAAQTFQHVALAGLPSPSLWRQLTNREITRRYRPHAPVPLITMQEALDLGTYGPEALSREQLAQIRALAEDVAKQRDQRKTPGSR